MSINKNKINEVLKQAIKPSKTKIMENTKKTLKEDELEDLLGTENPEAKPEETIEEPIVEPGAENIEELPGEELEPEPEPDFIEVTGVEEVEGGKFVIKNPAEVTLEIGNKVKFMVGDEEFKAEVKNVSEEGEVEIEPIESEIEPGAEEKEIEELPGTEEPENKDKEEITGTEEEDIIEEIIEEGTMDAFGKLGHPQENYLYNEDNTDGNIIETILQEEDPLNPEAAATDVTDAPVDVNTPAAPAEGPVGTAPGVETPGVEAPGVGTTASGSPTIPGAEEESGIIEPGTVDTGAGISMGGGGSASSAAPAATTEPGAAPEAAPAVQGGADANQVVNDIINNLVSAGDEEDPLETLIQTEDVIGGVMKEAKENIKVNPEIKDASTEAKTTTKLGDKDITGKVKDSKDGGKVPGVGKAKVNPATAQGDLKTKKLGDKDIDGGAPAATKGKVHMNDVTSTVKDNKDSAINPGDDFTSKVKKENVLKSRALVILGEKYVKLEDDNKKLRFENYKLLKLNGLITLLPELNQSTREQLVEKFDKLANAEQVQVLYKKIVGVVKESRKPSLNQLVTEKRNDVQYFSEGKRHDQHALIEKVQSKASEVDSEQARKNYLMGIPGNDDSYYNF